MVRVMPEKKLSCLFWSAIKAKMKNKNVLILCLADPSRNPRPKRMISLCNELGATVFVAAFPSLAPVECKEYFNFRYPCLKVSSKIGRKLIKVITLAFPVEAVSEWLNGYRWGFRSVRNAIQGRTFDLVIVHDAWLLPFSFKVAQGAPVVFDAREYYPGGIGGSFLWNLLERPEKLRICKKYMSRCDAVMTVSPGIAERYQEEFGIQCALIRSVPDAHEILPRPTHPEKIKMVHHGGANKDRKIENMIDMFSVLDNRFELDFYLTGDRSYIDGLRKRAEKYPAIKFKDPVPFDGIIPMLSAYDIGLYLLAPTGFNTERSLPNKFFEFIQARLMVAIGPSPDMADLVRGYGCGVVSADFSPQSLASFLSSLSASDIDRYKSASNKAAVDLRFDVEKKKIVKIFDSILMGHP